MEAVRVNNPIKLAIQAQKADKACWLSCQTRHSMDHLLDCYLSHLETSPRNTLHDRRNRQSMVAYIGVLIEGYIRGMNSDPQIAVRDAIIAIIRHHEKNRADNGSVCMMGKFHNVLYVAVRVCFDWQLKDTGTVVALLENIYECEKTFERIFIGAIFGNKAPYYIAGWKSDFDNQEENVRAMMYFLDHATCAGLDFGGVRFVDVAMTSCGSGATPAKIALQLGLPDKLLILLRFGAVLEDELIQYTMRRLTEFCHVYPYNIVSCLQLVLRALPRIACTRDVLLDNYSDLLEDALIPASRCGLHVVELKHLTRCCIRRRLWENCQLPHGITDLQLPDSLKIYLDLLQD